MFSTYKIPLKYLVLLSIWLDYLWEQYLRARQYQRTRVSTELPVILRNSMTNKAFDKARSYTLQRKRYEFLKDFLSIVTTTTIIHCDILPLIWRNACSVFEKDETLQSCLWYLTITILVAFVNLPLTLYEIFIIENNRSKRNGCLAWERFKTFVLSQLFLMLISSGIIALMRQEEKILLGLWVAFCCVVFMVGSSYPNSAPSRFRRISPLPNGDLKDQVFDLAKELNFQLTEVFVEEGLRKAPTHILYFFRNSKGRNLVINEFVIQKEDGIGCSNEEILAVFALHFSKWYYSHTLKYVTTLILNLNLSFLAFYILYKTPQVYEAFGFHDFYPILVGVYVILKYCMALYSTLLSFTFMYVSRKLVQRNDQFVARLGKGSALIAGLLRMEKKNLSFPIYDHLYSLWHHDKPPLLERIDAIKEISEIKFD